MLLFLLPVKRRFKIYYIEVQKSNSKGMKENLMDLEIIVRNKYASPRINSKKNIGWYRNCVMMTIEMVI